ncbi:sulfatase [uncultured Bacteroides sp.]|uniref:sulfatase family protein n=1 Tax=uncultured Bacteroides sp. TaxID=162156 RepID=UPI00258E09F7|nr:sulfatase [uncultured Bacteroides sp.]
MKTTLLLSMAATPLAAFAQQKPNIVIYIADDHGCLQSEPYGDTFVRTPNMARLANEGMTFDQAFVASPASGPSRAALLSGLMPARNGAEANHTTPRADTQILVKRLQDLGYEVAAIGKIAHGKEQADMNHFDYLQITGNIREKLAGTVKAYLDRRTSQKPLCLLVGDRRPHVSWIEQNIYDTSRITLPDYLIDTPETREHWGRYLTDITGLDESIGQVDKYAEEYFGNRDYLFIYTADHGAQWPFGKWNLYDKGTRTAMLARWKGKIEPGTRTAAMVSWIDLMPTLIDIAGGKPVENIDGKSFREVLFNKDKKHREIIYTTHTNDGNMNVYPMRAVRTEKYKYIRNLLPDCYHSNHSDIHRKDGAGAYWDSWDEAARTDKEAAEKIRHYYQRPAEEFYDIVNDPDEKHNLADNPAYKEEMQRMSVLLDKWMSDQGDTQRLTKKPYPLSGPTPHECNLKKEPKKKK